MKSNVEKKDIFTYQSKCSLEVLQIKSILIIALYLSKMSTYYGLWWFSVWYSASVFTASILYHLEVFVSISKTADLTLLFFVDYIHSVLITVK